VKNTSLIINTVLGAQLLVHLGGWFYLKGEKEEAGPVAANKQTAIIGKFVVDEAAVEAERVAAEWAAAEAERIAIEESRCGESCRRKKTRERRYYPC